MSRPIYGSAVLPGLPVEMSSNGCALRAGRLIRYLKWRVRGTSTSAARTDERKGRECHTARALRARSLHKSIGEGDHGEIRQGGVKERQDGDAPTEARHAQERFRQARDEPQAGDRHCPGRGATERCEGATKSEQTFVRPQEVGPAGVRPARIAGGPGAT